MAANRRLRGAAHRPGQCADPHHGSSCGNRTGRRHHTDNAESLLSGKGAKESAAAVGSLLGLDFQNYAVITYANLEKMMGYFGNGVIFDIPENLSYQDTGTGYFIEMDGGRRTLTAPQMLNVLRYPQWNGRTAADRRYSGADGSRHSEPVSCPGPRSKTGR